MQTASPGQDGVRSTVYNSEPSPKRRRTRKVKDEEMPEEATHQPYEPSNGTVHDEKRHDSMESIAITPKEASQAAPFPSLLNMANAAPSSYTSQAWPPAPIASSIVDQPALANSTYFDPGAYVPLETYFPQVAMNGTDPNYWGSFDFNATDVFESAAWENLIGSTEPDMSHWTFRV